jgi:stage II sporulation protein M
MIGFKSRFLFSHQREIMIPAAVTLGALVCGLICGALVLHRLSPTDQGELRQFLTDFLRNASALPHSGQPSAFNSWLEVLKNQAVTIGLLWILGLTAIGIPLIIMVVAGRGFILGFTVGFLVQEKAAQGLVLALVAVLPQNLCYVPACLISGTLACYFSFTLLRGMRENPVTSGLVVYTMIFLLIFLLVLLGTWLEAYLVPGLVRLATTLF